MIHSADLGLLHRKAWCSEFRGVLTTVKTDLCDTGNVCPLLFYIDINLIWYDSRELVKAYVLILFDVFRAKLFRRLLGNSHTDRGIYTL